MSELNGEEMPILFANARKDKSALSRNSRIRWPKEISIMYRHWAPICSIVHTVSTDTGPLAPAATGIVRAAWPRKAGNV
jgi:hypothetical protein